MVLVLVIHKKKPLNYFTIQVHWFEKTWKACPKLKRCFLPSLNMVEFWSWVSEKKLYKWKDNKRQEDGQRTKQDRNSSLWAFAHGELKTANGGVTDVTEWRGLTRDATEHQ